LAVMTRDQKRSTQLGLAVVMLALGVAIFLAEVMRDHPLLTILGTTLVIISVLLLLVTWLF
jgi:hypothetical protein